MQTDRFQWLDCPEPLVLPEWLARDRKDFDLPSPVRIRRRASDLLDWAHVGKPPVDVYAIAAQLGVRLVAWSRIGSEGITIRLDYYLGVILRSDRCESTHRLTMAHEIGHIVLDEGFPAYAMERATYAFNEAAVECFAEVLLMPAAWVTHMRSCGASISEIARTLGVTPRVAAKRVRALSYMMNGATRLT
jgi:hypothetical protein